MLRNQVGISNDLASITLLLLISGDNNFTDALSGDNNFICRSSARQIP
jgi:hypothetical protein